VELLSSFNSPLGIVAYILCGFLFWYSIYGAECAIRRRVSEKNIWLAPFTFLKEEFKWALQRRPKVKAASQQNVLPGRFHFLLMHILLPLLWPAPFALMAVAILLSVFYVLIISPILKKKGGAPT